MNREEIGEFLYRFYRKRTSSFLANLYKASVTGDSRDIHRARLDIKKIFALYGLFEMLEPEVFKHQGGYKLLRPLYRRAGKIREIQVDYLLLTNPEPLGACYNSFIAWLKEEERISVAKFFHLVKNFKESELTSTNKIIHKICSSSSIFKLRSKTLEFIKVKVAQIKYLQSEELGDKEIHKIRQNLKLMSTITTLVYSIRPGKQFDLIISAINKTEMMIGDWHDRVVLKDAIEWFLEANTTDLKAELISLNHLKQSLIADNQNLIKHFIPEVNAIVKSVLDNV